MYTVPVLSAGTARANGREQSRSELLDQLALEWQKANEAFMLFRDQDPYYEDPRTDYMLGRRDFIEAVLEQVRTL